MSVCSGLYGESSRVPGRRKSLLFPAGLLAGLLVFAGGVFRFGWLTDDAYISFRYVENAAGGHGLVFNPGESVEGYTNQGWLLLLLLLRFLGIGVEASSWWLGLASGCLLIFLTGCLARLVGGDVGHGRLPRRRSRPPMTDPGSGSGRIDDWVPALSMLLVGLSPALALWGTSGLETGLWAALLLGCQVAGIGGRWGWAALLGALATVVRLDSAVFVAGALIFAQGGWRARLRTWFLFGLLLVPGELLRLVLYGAWVPNTAVAKGGLGLDRLAAGAEYLGRFIMGTAGWVLLVGMVIYGVLRGRWDSPRKLGEMEATSGGGRGTQQKAETDWARDHAYVQRRRWRILLFPGLLWVIYLVSVGGDFLPYYRFCLPLVPILVVGGLIGWWSVGKRALVVASILAAVGIILDGSAGREYRQAGLRRRAERERHEIGRYLRRHWPPDTVIALNAAGIIPYESGFRTIDMMGLCDPEIARSSRPGVTFIPGHSRCAPDVVLEREPDLILPGVAALHRVPLTDGVPPEEAFDLLDCDRLLLELPRFQREYRPISVWLKKGRAFNFYRRGAAGIGRHHGH